MDIESYKVTTLSVATLSFKFSLNFPKSEKNINTEIFMKFSDASKIRTFHKENLFKSAKYLFLNLLPLVVYDNLIK